jgi:hypothetical protein
MKTVDTQLLHCHSTGDQRFSALFARIDHSPVRPYGRSIETIYQGAKRNEQGHLLETPKPGNPYKAREQEARPGMSDYADRIKNHLLQEMQCGKLSQAHYTISLAELEHCDQLSDEGVAARFNEIDACYLSRDTMGEQAVEMGIRWKIARGFLWERGLLYWSGEEPRT